MKAPAISLIVCAALMCPAAASFAQTTGTPPPMNGGMQHDGDHDRMDHDRMDHDRMDHDRDHRGEGIPPMLRELNLTDAQKDKIKAIQQSQAPQSKEIMKTNMQDRRELMELSMSGQFSDEKARSLANRLGHSTAELAMMHARTHSQIMGVLTEDQRAQLRRHMAEHEHDHDGMEHGGMHEGMEHGGMHEGMDHDKDGHH